MYLLGTFFFKKEANNRVNFVDKTPLIFDRFLGFRAQKKVSSQTLKILIINSRNLPKEVTQLQHDGR